MIDEKLMSVLGTRKFARIYSSKTKKLYMDSFFRCYLFESAEDARAFSEVTKDTYPDEKSDYIKTGQFLTNCFYDGFDAVRMKMSAAEGYTDIPLTKNDVKKQYNNRIADRDTVMYKQTFLAKYIRDLYHKEFLCPISIEKRDPQKYPGIHYATATIGNGIVCMILFTTYQGFEAWNKDNRIQYLPNKTTFSEFSSIRKDRPVIINPETDKLYLDDKTIEKIRGSRKKSTAKQEGDSAGKN